MRILVASTFAPLRPQSADSLAAGLTMALAERGHEPERVRIPFEDDPDTILEQMLALRLTEISDVGELLIAVGAPAHLLRHQRKVLWRTECCRAPDPWGARLERPPVDREGMRLRDALTVTEKLACGEAQRVFAGSTAGCERLRRSSGADVGLLAPPLRHTEPRGAWDGILRALTG